MSSLPPQAKADICVVQNLADRAAAILQANDRGGYTVPSEKLYPYQWLWDAGFIALGWRVLDEARAWQELRAIMKGQWADGMVPHIVFHQTHESYMPGPEIWQVTHTPPTSGITQPPVLGTVLLQLYQLAQDKALAKQAVQELFPAILRFNQWFHRARDPQQTGLVATLHPWETGMDNSPAWDAPLARVKTDKLRPYVRKDTGLIDPTQRPHKDDYDRYMSLVFQFIDQGYDPARMYAEAQFKVADLATNAVLLRADRDLLKLAEEVVGDKAAADWLRPVIAQGRAALSHLWDSEAGHFFSRDLLTGEAIAIPTVASFMPLFAEAATSGQAEMLARQMALWQQRVPYAVPSLDPRHPSFEPKRYWRGAVWVNTNWMVASGLRDYGYFRLADEIKARTLALLRNGQFAEYYDPVTGAPLGSGNFSWTAALALHWQLFA